MHAHTPPHSDEEEDALLSEQRPQRRPRSLFCTRWTAHPYWLIPVVLAFSMSRGVTMSPRIQVYKAIACRALSDTTPSLAPLTGTDCGGSDVQARAAKIQAAVVTLMSVLSATSTGFWSRLGDIHGRKPILITFLSGALLMEAVFILVMRPNSFFGRHAERLILVGPIVEGFVGGISTFNGVVHAYVSDCTRHGSRSKIFSTIQGIVFVGLSLGPWFGGLFLPKTGYSDSFFFSSITLLVATMLYLAFMCPESRISTSNIVNTNVGGLTEFKAYPVQTVRRLSTKFIAAVASPIGMFTPRRIRGTRRLSWNMTLVGLGFFLYCVSIGIYSAKYLYAQHVYSWTTAQLGYYMSTLWISRALNLLIFLPIIISYLKPKPSSSGTQPSPSDVAAELVFDKYLVQCSLFVDGLADTIIAIISNKSQPVFVLLSCLASFTSGGNPALQSLGAICLHALGQSDEVGAFFGALGVLNSIAHIISPTIFATTYGATVASFPQAIFILAAVLLFTVVVLLVGVRPSSMTPYVGLTSPSTDDVEGHVEDYTDLGNASGTSSVGGEERERRHGSSYKYDSVGTSPSRRGSPIETNSTG